VPTTLIAAALFVFLVLPGYLFQNGYREHCYVQKPDRDLYAIAQPIAISAVLVCVVSAIVGIFALDTLANKLFDDDLEDGLNGTQSAGIVVAVLVPYFAGRFAGWLVAKGSWPTRKLLKPHPRLLSLPQPPGFGRLRHSLRWRAA